MKRFTFTLQAVENLTLSTEKQQKTRIKQIEDYLSRLRIQLEQMKEAYLDAKERCAEEMKIGLSSEVLAQYSAYFESLIQSMIQQKEKILRSETELDEWLQKLVQTKQELKTLEKLKETQYEQYLLEEKQEAEKEIGDVVSFNVASK